MKSKLYGRRILHVLSPVRFNGNVFNHESDSNYKTAEKIISWLPDCHHYVLVPENNKIVDNRKNVTLLKFNYPKNAVSNRSQFDVQSFLKVVDMKNMDFDFLITHQPELLYNVLITLMDKRYGEILHKFSLFHWIDCPASRGSPAIPHSYMRQFEAINLSDKILVHTPESIRYWMNNFKNPKSVKMDLEYIKSKTIYMPTSGLSIESLKLHENPNISNPKNKPIVVFNHRWSQSTGINRFLEYTESITDKYLFVITDSNAENVPDGYYVVPNPLSLKQYAGLLHIAKAAVCFVDDYATWNLSVQDSINAGTPVCVYKHPIMPYIIENENTKFGGYFETKGEFQTMLSKLQRDVRDNESDEGPNHDKIFKENLVGQMEKCLKDTTGTPKDAYAWVYCILKGLHYKSEITGQVQPNLGLNSVWQYIRRWLLMNGIEDDPNMPYPRYSVMPGREDELKKLIKDIDIKIESANRKKPTIAPKNNPFF